MNFNHIDNIKNKNETKDRYYDLTIDIRSIQIIKSNAKRQENIIFVDTKNINILLNLILSHKFLPENIQCVNIILQKEHLYLEEYFKKESMNLNECFQKCQLIKLDGVKETMQPLIKDASGTIKNEKEKSDNVLPFENEAIFDFEV